MTEARTSARLTAIEKRQDEFEQRQAQVMSNLRELGATQVEILFAINQCLGRLDVLTGARRAAFRVEQTTPRVENSAIETPPAGQSL
jgi:hypothetical protein